MTFQTRQIRIVGQMQKDTAIAAIQNLPVLDKPLVVTIGEERKARKQDQNSLMWSGPLADIAEQAWWEGRQYSAEAWHLTYKRLYLPEVFDPALCLDGYQKWDTDRDGEKILVGSTKKLTVKGFAQYLEQVIADGAGMGVLFHQKEAA